MSTIRRSHPAFKAVRTTSASVSPFFLPYWTKSTRSLGGLSAVPACRTEAPGVSSHVRTTVIVAYFERELDIGNNLWSGIRLNANTIHSPSSALLGPIMMRRTLLRHEQKHRNIHLDGLGRSDWVCASASLPGF